ncbi:MAG TPA: GvpL/GvpF family gas vesicle protein [Blastocatellia bacterium]|nr:GvpL/GvpF family gas vesicle protein [Blastocatellia bacterium]
MSERKPKKKDDGAEGGRAFYVYCIAERAALQKLFDKRLPQAIESDARLELINEDDLAAVASSVPLADYGEQALQERFNDAAWAATRAMRHERVVEHFASRASVIPLRFATIYLSRERVRQRLAEKCDELHRIIERLEGREEWGVNVYRNRAKLMEAIATLSPRLRELGEQAAAASPGQSYLLKKKIEAMKADEARAETGRVVAEIERELGRASDGAARLTVMKGEASEAGETVAKLAFLVERARFDQFRDAAETLAEKHADSGFMLEMTGPWPAYNFAGTKSKK